MHRAQPLSLLIQLCNQRLHSLLQLLQGLHVVLVLVMVILFDASSKANEFAIDPLVAVLVKLETQAYYAEANIKAKLIQDIDD